jgi:hypothetical protein
MFGETIRRPKRFEVRWESRFGSWADDIGILLSRQAAPTGNIWPFRTMGKGGRFRPVRGFLTSAFLHVSAFVLIAELGLTAGYETRRKPEATDTTPL